MLALDRGEAAERLEQARDSERYRALIERLGHWRTAPPLSPLGERAEAAAVDHVAAARKKARKRLRQAGEDPEGLHRARKATKRLRYAAELAQAARLNGEGPDMSRLADRAKKRQTLLGEHQDAMVAAAYLRRLGTTGGADGRNGFTFGLLLAEELRRAADIRASLR